jgi:hypothetical protein
MATMARKRIGSARRPPRSRRPGAAVALGLARTEAEPPGCRGEPVSPGILRARWRIAFDAAQAALRAGNLYLSAQELREHTNRLGAEREPTALLLQAYARDQRASAPSLHLLLPPMAARRLVGLPLDVTACVFNLDGVLIGSAAVHAAAWTETFDEFISRRVERTHGRFAPFNPHIDYPAHIHGKPRLDGVRAFLASRGIRLPEGDPRDPPDPDGEPFGEEPHPPPGSTSTSEPHPSKDPEAGDRWEGPKRDKLDD